MPAEYELWLVDHNGNRLCPPLENAKSFTYTHAMHNLGFFSVVLPESFMRELVGIDRRVLFFRKPDNASMKRDFVGFTRRKVTETDTNSVTTRLAQGYSANHLLDGRIVYAAAGSSQAQKTAAVDNMMKAIVTEQAGTSAATARQFDSAFFSVQDNSSSGPSLTKGFAYRPMLDVLRELNEASRQAGTEVFFQVMPLDIDKFVFVTSTTQLGRDVSDRVEFSLERENLSSVRLVEDWSNERNFGYGLGGDTGADRYIATSEVTERSGISWYGRREVTKDARTQDDAGAQTAAYAIVTEHRPLTTFAGAIKSIPGCAYGVDWYYGDRVAVSYDGRTFDAIIRAVTVSVDEGGKETISARLEAYL